MSSAMVPYLLRNWDDTCKRVKKGLEKLGHDIPITGYCVEEELRVGTRKSKKSKKE